MKTWKKEKKIEVKIERKRSIEAEYMSQRETKKTKRTNLKKFSFSFILFLLKRQSCFYQQPDFS